MATTLLTKKLPLDVIWEILSHLAAPKARTGTDIEPYSTHPHPVPWELALIDRAWRECAVHSGDLWTRIHVGYYQYPADALVQLEVQLRRCGTKLLDVTLANDDPFSVLQDSPALLASCPRWETLRLLLDDPFFTVEFDSTEGDFEALRRLEILCTFACESTEDVPEIPDVSNTPNLSELILTDSEFECISPNVTLDWEQITHLRVFCDSPGTLYDTARAASNLVELGLRIQLPDADNATAPAIAVFPRLKRLYVHAADWLNFLRAPALRDLTCRASRLRPLINFTFRSKISNSLRTLILTGFSDSREGLAKLMDVFSGLTKLAVQDARLPGLGPAWETPFYLFSGLKAVPNNIGVLPCPQLEAFIYSCLVAPSEDMEAFFDMVKTRIGSADRKEGEEGERCLRYVRYFWGINPYPERSSYEEDVRNLRSGGLDIELTQSGLNAFDEITRGWLEDREEEEGADEDEEEEEGYDEEEDVDSEEEEEEEESD
ncbi:hypothetical protein R3P38DRAFT_3293698 [Favolaschia claudopus]|uniref:F-box domain-containing protein n=1 Tax=Favolaschia claudopus TaxID=2862362 RepID=A0AAV9ZHI3_9AGAR